jgi:hypothetical protein
VQQLLTRTCQNRADGAGRERERERGSKEGERRFMRMVTHGVGLSSAYGSSIPTSGRWEREGEGEGEREKGGGRERQPPSHAHMHTHAQLQDWHFKDVLHFFKASVTNDKACIKTISEREVDGALIASMNDKEMEVTVEYACGVAGVESLPSSRFRWRRRHGPQSPRYARGVGEQAGSGQLLLTAECSRVAV